MSKPKILLVCEQFQAGEKTALKNAIYEAGKSLGIKEDDLKAALTQDLIQEELITKEWPVAMTEQADKISRILAVGIAAYNKVEIFKDKGIQIERIPQPRSWDDKMRADTVVAIARVLNGWIPKTPSTLPRVQTPLAAKPTTDAGSHNASTTKTKAPGFFDPPTEEEKAKAAAVRPKGTDLSVPCKTCDGRGQILRIYERPGGPPGNGYVKCPTCSDATSSPAIRSAACPTSEAIVADLEALETMLKVEVSNSRLQACIFNWSKDGSTLEIKNAGVVNRVALEGLVPILVDDSVLKDERKLKEVRAELDRAGYKTPYLMPIREFMVLVRMYQILAKERKLVLELVV